MSFSGQLEPEHDYRITDLEIGLPDDDQIERLAARMEKLHRGSKSTTVFREGHRKIGLLGERHVGRTFRLKMDLRLLPNGSRRVNFTLRDGTTVDVITRTMLKSGAYPDLTMKRKGRNRADVLLLCVWHGYGFEPELVGWIDRNDLERHGRVENYRGEDNYVAHAGELRPIWELMERHRPEWALAMRLEEERTLDIPAPAPKPVSTAPVQQSLI